MDIDRYIVTNEESWRQLRTLVDRGRRLSRLTDPEVEQLIALYQRASSQLSHVRTHYDDGALINRLTVLLADANGLIHGSRRRARLAVPTFFTTTFPAAVWGSRRFVLASFLLTFVPAIVLAVWLTVSDRAVEATATDAVREAYIQEDFEAYYSSAPAAQFSTEVLVNNIQVSFFAFAGGLLLGLGTVVILVYNGANVGVAAGLFHSAGEAPLFYGLILPHGLLELTAVVVAGAAGLQLGWAVLVPGDRSRSAALAQQARRSVAIVLGLMAAFIVAGLIEGFVTPSGLPTWTRVLVGAAVEAAFVLYIIVYGRRAEARGFVGDWGETRDHHSPPVALMAR